MRNTSDSFGEFMKVFRHELFELPEGQTYAQRCALAYRQMKFLNDLGYTARSLRKDPARLLKLLECAAVASPVLAMLLANHHFNTLGTIFEHAGDYSEQIDMIDELDSLRAVGTFVITEIGHGNSHARLKTEARFDRERGDFVLHTPDPSARKYMAANSLPGVAKHGVVIARLLDGDTDHGTFPFLVPLRSDTAVLPGIDIRPMPESPYSPMDYSIISFDKVRVPGACLLSSEVDVAEDGALQVVGDKARRDARTLQLRRYAWIALAVRAAATGRAVITVALRFAHRRHTQSWDSEAERPVLDYRLQQYELFGALASVYATTSLVERAKAGWLDTLDPRTVDSAWAPGQAFHRTLSLVRVAAARDVERVAAACSWRSGAHGLFGSNRIAEYHGLAHILNPASGDGELLSMIAVREMVAEEHYRPPQPVRVDPDPCDPRFWCSLAAIRECAVHAELVARVRTARKAGGDEHSVFNDVFLIGRSLIDAHLSRLTLECFLDMAEEAPLRWLCALYALQRPAEAFAWHLANGSLATDTFAQIPDAINTVCERLQPHAPELTDAFGLPDEIIRAPLATETYPDSLFTAGRWEGVIR
ncbi:acyl-CoA dehydrogenase [Nocardia pneumoniae]|uniref:acyl-CoA dehydrogenase n=1 Tax=Nocardia pneumoniae TaxID=228601 RepID=UPI0012F6645B|nr:acyl-CoA dehydrogenase [Nocardia pneumoniae]